MTIGALTWVEFAAGMALLFVGGELLVRGAVSLARRFGVSPMLIGATVVAFGTSAPELVVSLQAATRGVVDIAIGNVLGSNLANMLLILGVTITIAPIMADRAAVRRDALTLGVATMLVVGLAYAGLVPRFAGVLMLAALLGHVIYGYWSERRRMSAAAEAALHIREADEAEGTPQPMGMASVYLLFGIVGVVAGAHFLVESGTTIARAAGISEAVIGLTIVALGTSLPELATSVVAAIRRHGDVALGNVLGSSLFNILGIFGVVAIVKPIEIPAEIANFDVWVLLGVTALILLPVLAGWRLGRLAGALLLALYTAYILLHYL